MSYPVMRKIYGAAELALFMKGGIEAFDHDKRAALRSVLIPLVCAIPGFFYAIHFPAADLETAPVRDIVLIGLLRIVIAYPLGLFLVYHISGWLDAQRHFWRWMQAYNWMDSIMLVVMGVPKLLVAIGAFTKCFMYQYTVFLEVYGYAVLAYLFYRAFRINAYLAIGLACFMLLINQETGRLLFAVFGYGFDPRSGNCPTTG